MQKFVLSAVALLAAAGAASAADLSYRQARPLPPAAVTSNWTGCYLGGHVGWGYAWSEHNNTANTTAFGDFLPGQGFASQGSGLAGGGHVGCNYQMGRLVYGIEGSYTATDIKGDYTSVAGVADDQFSHKITGIGSITGRFGMAFDQWFYYTKLGWAFARNEVSVVDVVAPAGAGSDAHWHNGVTIGSGFEYALTRNWILGFETNYYRFETKSYELGGGAGLYTFDVRPRDVYTGLARASYKF